MKGRILGLVLSMGLLLVAAGCASSGSTSSPGDRQTVGGPGDPGSALTQGENR